ncbi:hypothetical protein U1Q18_026536 [Sarracenia purpurea var. burkii]
MKLTLGGVADGGRWQRRLHDSHREVPDLAGLAFGGGRPCDSRHDESTGLAGLVRWVPRSLLDFSGVTFLRTIYDSHVDHGGNWGENLQFLGMGVRNLLPPILVFDKSNQRIRHRRH